MLTSKYYVTPTLLNAWLNGYESFFDLLYRRETEITESMQKGLDYEKSIVNGEIPELNDLLDGALYQTFLYKPINDYIGVLGYSDFIKFDTIYDAKYVSSYDGLGKYKNSCQHLIYPYCANIDNFVYIIGYGKDIYYEGYMRDDKKLFGIIKQFLLYLKITGLKKVFEKNYGIERKIDLICK